jgi:photosystem II stability/assembly factor-like uncharacterized protein
MQKLVLLLVVFLLYDSGNAQSQYIFTNGPSDGGFIRDFFIHDDYWFVAQEEFILRSNNEGQTWEILNTGLPQSDIKPLSFASFDGYLYVSTNSEHRMLRSSDSGETWSKFNNNLPSFFGIPTYSSPKMVVSNNRLVALPSGNAPVAYLNAGGNNWQLTTYSVAAAGTGLAVVGNDSLMASIGSTLRLSVDNGATWVNFPEILFPSIGQVGASDFLKIGERVIVTTVAGGANGIRVSNSGLTGWTSPEGNFFVGGQVGQKLIHVSDDHILALGSDRIMKSTDLGASWQEVTTEDTRPLGITVFMKPLDDNRLIVGTTSGLFIYTNMGEGERQSVDLPVGNVTIFNTFEFSGGLLAEHDGNLSTYDFSANAWTRRLDMRNLGYIHHNDLIRGNRNLAMLGERIVLYSYEKTMISAEGTSAANLSEDSFSDLGLPLETFIVASTHAFGNTWVILGGELRRESFGTFWRNLKIYISSDGGSTWQESTHNVPDAPAAIPSRGPLFKGSKSIVHNGKWYIGGESGLIRSSDNGQTWTRIQTGSRVVLSSMDGALFMSSSDDFGHNILKSTDDGDNWVTWHEGLPTSTFFARRTYGLVQVDDVLYTYNDPSASIAPQPGEKGLFKLTSADGNWTLVEDHPTIPFYPNLMLASNGYIFAVQPKAGYWRSPQVGTSTSVEGDLSQIPASAVLLPNYPNPFNPSTTIRYELHEAASVQVRVYNVLGQQVFDSGLARHAAGLHQLEFNGLGLASGVYVYRLEVDGRVAGVRNMLLMK